MYYLQASKVKATLHKAGYQITPDALHVIDVKVGEFLDRLMKQWNGHHKRITKELVGLTNIK
jgi:hypothetical protein